MFCIKCGKEIKTGASFCRYCGGSQDESSDNKEERNEMDRGRKLGVPGWIVAGVFLSVAVFLICVVITGLKNNGSDSKEGKAGKTYEGRQTEPNTNANVDDGYKTDTDPEYNGSEESDISTYGSMDDTVKKEGKADIKQIYREYFYKHHCNDDIVCLADVTHDGKDEMIVVSFADSYWIEGFVYTIKDNEVVEIFEKSGAEDHAGGFFSWYLADKGEYYNLAEEYFGMWQGLGETRYDEYYLSPEGERMDCFSIKCPRNSEDTDYEGRVTDKALSDYGRSLSNALEQDYYIYANYSEVTKVYKIMETDPQNIFGEETDHWPA